MLDTLFFVGVSAEEFLLGTAPGQHWPSDVEANFQRLPHNVDQQLAQLAEELSILVKFLRDLAEELCLKTIAWHTQAAMVRDGPLAMTVFLKVF